MNRRIKDKLFRREYNPYTGKIIQKTYKVPEHKTVYIVRSVRHMKTQIMENSFSDGCLPLVYVVFGCGKDLYFGTPVYKENNAYYLRRAGAIHYNITYVIRSRFIQSEFQTLLDDVLCKNIPLLL